MIKLVIRKGARKCAAAARSCRSSRRRGLERFVDVGKLGDEHLREIDRRPLDPPHPHYLDRGRPMLIRSSTSYPRDR